MKLTKVAEENGQPLQLQREPHNNALEVVRASLKGTACLDAIKIFAQEVANGVTAVRRLCQLAKAFNVRDIGIPELRRAASLFPAAGRRRNEQYVDLRSLVRALSQEQTALLRRPKNSTSRKPYPPMCRPRSAGHRPGSRPIRRITQRTVETPRGMMDKERHHPVRLRVHLMWSTYRSAMLDDNIFCVLWDTDLELLETISLSSLQPLGKGIRISRNRFLPSQHDSEIKDVFSKMMSTGAVCIEVNLLDLPREVFALSFIIFEPPSSENQAGLYSAVRIRVEADDDDDDDDGITKYRMDTGWCKRGYFAGGGNAIMPLILHRSKQPQMWTLLPVKVKFRGVSLVELIPGILLVMQRLQVIDAHIIHIEHCRDCSGHQTSTRHIPGSYEAFFNLLEEALQYNIPTAVVRQNDHRPGFDAVIPFSPRLGSFEISLLDHRTGHWELLFSKRRSDIERISLRNTIRTKEFPKDPADELRVVKYILRSLKNEMKQNNSKDARKKCRVVSIRLVDAYTKAPLVKSTVELIAFRQRRWTFEEWGGNRNSTQSKAVVTSWSKIFCIWQTASADPYSEERREGGSWVTISLQQHEIEPYTWKRGQGANVDENVLLRSLCREIVTTWGFEDISTFIKSMATIEDIPPSTARRWLERFEMYDITDGSILLILSDDELRFLGIREAHYRNCILCYIATVRTTVWSSSANTIMLPPEGQQCIHAGCKMRLKCLQGKKCAMIVVGSGVTDENGIVEVDIGDDYGRSLIPRISASRGYPSCVAPSFIPRRCINMMILPVRPLEYPITVRLCDDSREGTLLAVRHQESGRTRYSLTDPLHGTAHWLLPTGCYRLLDTDISFTMDGHEKHIVLEGNDAIRAKQMWVRRWIQLQASVRMFTVRRRFLIYKANTIRIQSWVRQNSARLYYRAMCQAQSRRKAAAETHHDDDDVRARRSHAQVRAASFIQQQWRDYQRSNGTKSQAPQLMSLAGKPVFVAGCRERRKKKKRVLKHRKRRNRLSAPPPFEITTRLTQDALTTMIANAVERAIQQKMPKPRTKRANLSRVGKAAARKGRKCGSSMIDGGNIWDTSVPEVPGVGTKPPSFSDKLFDVIRPRISKQRYSYVSEKPGNSPPKTYRPNPNTYRPTRPRPMMPTSLFESTMRQHFASARHGVATEIVGANVPDEAVQNMRQKHRDKKREYYQEAALIAAKWMQNTWRKYRREKQEDQAALTVQKGWRIHAAYCRMCSLRTRRRHLLSLQSWWRRMALNIRCDQRKDMRLVQLVFAKLQINTKEQIGARRIQCWWIYIRDLQRRALLQRIAADIAATSLQCLWRCYSARSRLRTNHLEQHAATSLQGIWRRYVAGRILRSLRRTQYRKKRREKRQQRRRKYNAAASVIQKFWKRFHFRMKARSELQHRIDSSRKSLQKGHRRRDRGERGSNKKKRRREQSRTKKKRADQHEDHEAIASMSHLTRVPLCDPKQARSNRDENLLSTLRVSLTSGNRSRTLPTMSGTLRSPPAMILPNSSMRDRFREEHMEAAQTTKKKKNKKNVGGNDEEGDRGEGGERRHHHHRGGGAGGAEQQSSRPRRLRRFEC